MTLRSSLLLCSLLATGCPDSTVSDVSGADARVRMAADLGDIRGRGCATGTVDLRTIEGIDVVQPFCAESTRECVDGCGDDACTSACVDADPRPSPFMVDGSGCAVCFDIQRNACLTELCPDAVAELTCCIEDHAECATDDDCSPCGDRWDVFDACLDASDCSTFQDFCFVQP